MMWVLMALVAVILGLMLFSGLQGQLPDELAFLRGRPTPARAVPVDSLAPSDVTVHGWQVVSRGAVTELTKPFTGGIQAGVHQYDAPVLGLMCDGQTLHLRVDVQAPVTGRTHTPVRMAGVETAWFKAQGTNVLAPDAKATARRLLKATVHVPFEFSYLDVGWANVLVDTTGLREAAGALPPACRF